MRFFDKVKDMFTEEVEEPVKEEIKVEKVEPKKKEKISFSEIMEKETKRQEEKKPVFFTDEDFNEMDFKRKKEDETPKREESEDNFRSKSLLTSDYSPLKEKNKPILDDTKEFYQGNVIEEKPVGRFKPTPIISPIYGILDKNYHKEDIINKQDKDYKPLDGLTVDTVKDKNYSTLEDELENTLFGKNSILFKEEKEEPKKEENFEETTKEVVSELDQLIEKEENTNLKEKTVKVEVEEVYEEQKKEEDDDDLFDLIDNMYEGDDKK